MRRIIKRTTTTTITETWTISWGDEPIGTNTSAPPPVADKQIDDQPPDNHETTDSDQ